MKQVEDIFKPSTKDVLSLFSNNGIIFQIPSYQRNYSWKNSDIERLLKDIKEGLNKKKTDSELQSLCFLGSVITVNISEKIDQVACPLNVVDGQQRLTTLILILLSINQYLHQKFYSINFHLNRTMEWIVDELSEIENLTISCLYEIKKRDNKISEYMPKIVREGLDKISFKEGNYLYSSPISKLLHSYAKYLIERKEGDFFKWPLDNSEECKSIENAKKVTMDFLEKSFELEKESVSDLLQSQKSFFNLKDYDQNKIVAEIEESANDKKEIYRIIKTFSFTKFLFSSLVITEVRTYEEYQFDAFESLNTTGVPLTALDIFRAKALSTYHSKENHQIEKCDIEKLDKIDEYILSFPLKSRSKISRDIVNSFIVYVSGEKTEDHLSWQRNKLVELYETSAINNYTSSIISSLHETMRFYVEFWDKENIKKQLDNHPRRAEILLYINYFIDLDSSLSIPILTRFVNNFNDESLYKMVKSLAIFTVLWRVSHSSTSGIDSVYRKLMSGTSNNSPLCVGSVRKNDILDEKSIIEFLKFELRKKKISDFETWMSKFKGVRIYEVSKPTTRLALLLTHFKAAPINEKSSTLTKENVKLTEGNDILNISTWNNPRYNSIEHIAPQNIKDSSDWDDKIYIDGDVIPNCLGNLTLLPQSENSAIGNKRWEIKRNYLSCFLAGSTEEVYTHLDNLSLKGVTVKNSTKEIMLNNFALGVMVKPLIQEEYWNREKIERRQKNLSYLLWSIGKSVELV